MRAVDPEDFEQVVVRTHDDYAALLQRLRPHTASIEFAIHRHQPPNPLPELLADWVTETRLGVPARPGYAKPSPTSTLLTVRAHRDVFAALRSFEGFFRLSTDTRLGDRAEFTDFGNVDVAFRDRTGAIVFWTVTHEGLAFAHPDVL